MPLKNLILSNTFSQLVSKVITSLLGLFTRKLLTNYLGPAGFGDYIFLLTYASLFNSIADWGTITISIREASKPTSNYPQIFGSAIIGRLVLSIIAAMLATLFSPFLIHHNFSASIVMVTSLLIITMSLKASLGIIFETLLQMHRWILVDVTSSVLTLLFFIYAVSLNLPLIYFLIFLILASIIASFTALLLALKITKLDFSFNFPLLLHLAKESFPMGLAMIMFSIYNRIDTLLLGTYRSVSEVGFYGLAYFIYENIVLLAAYVLNSVYPLLSREAKNIQSFKQIFYQYYKSMFGLGLLALVVTFYMSPYLVILLSSSQFNPSIILLKILSFSLFFSYLNHVTGYSLIALGLQKKYSIITLAALIFNLVLNIILIPWYGAIAAAYITFATEAIVQFLSLFLFIRSVKLPS